MSNTKTPPVDRDGEMNRARLCLGRCRRDIAGKKANLPVEWQAWVYDSLAQSKPVIDQEAK